MATTRRYSVVEPHPHPSSTAYYGTGRGGAGNIVKEPNTTPGSTASGPPSKIPLNKNRRSSSSASTATFISGRGGAGNVHPASERAIFSFDEELERQLKIEQDPAPVFHTGRGGAGNYVYIDGSTRPRSERRDSEADSERSTRSAESGADVMNRKLIRGLGRGWDKIVGVGNYMIG